MNSSTRITRSEVVDLCETIFAANPDLPAFGARVLGLFLCVRLTLTYLRHNLPQGLLAELYGVSQATASRVITAYTPLIARALEVSVPTVEADGAWSLTLTAPTREETEDLEAYS